MKNAFGSILSKVFISVSAVIILSVMLSANVHAYQFTLIPGDGTLVPLLRDIDENSWETYPCPWTRQRFVFTGWERVGNNLFAQWRAAERISYEVTFKVRNGSWNNGSKNDIGKTLSRWEDEDLALVLGDGDIPPVGNNPDNGYSAGSWDTDPADYTAVGNHSIGANRTFTYTYSGSGPAPRTRPGDDDDHHEDAPPPAPKPVNPNAVTGMSFVGNQTGNCKIGPQVQGAAAQLAFRMNTPAGWKEAFSFNMTVNDKADYSLKKGILSFRIPSQYMKAGRKFAILGIDRNGEVKLFADTDLEADTITIDLDIEGYAFDLIYSD